MSGMPAELVTPVPVILRWEIRAEVEFPGKGWGVATILFHATFIWLEFSAKWLTLFVLSRYF